MIDQEIDIQRPLVRFVDNDGVVAVQVTVTLSFRQQNPVGHQFDESGRFRRITKTDLESDVLADRRIEFFGQSSGDRPRGNPPRLRMSDQATNTSTNVQADFW